MERDRWEQKSRSTKSLAWNLDSKVRSALANGIEYQIAEYYRAVRNCIIHRTDARKVATLLQSLRTKYDQALTTYCRGRPALNPIEGLSYHDYKLFTRALTALSCRINDAIDLQPDEALRVLAEVPGLYAKLKQYRGDERRLKKKASAAIRVRLGLRASAALPYVVALQEQILAL